MSLRTFHFRLSQGSLSQSKSIVFALLDSLCKREVARFTFKRLRLFNLSVVLDTWSSRGSCVDHAWSGRSFVCRPSLTRWKLITILPPWLWYLVRYFWSDPSTNVTLNYRDGGIRLQARIKGRNWSWVNKYYCMCTWSREIYPTLTLKRYRKWAHKRNHSIESVNEKSSPHYSRLWKNSATLPWTNRSGGLMMMVGVVRGEQRYVVGLLK